MGRVLLAVVLIPAICLACDSLLWAVRGSPTGQVTVNVFTVMELKGGKEDYGQPDVQTRVCNRRLFATGSVPTCWSLARHPDVVERP